MRKYKLTGCARFLIFLLIATPIAYFGASYYNNQNPIQTVKTWFAGMTEQSANPPATLERDSANTANSLQGDSSSEKEPPSGQMDASSQGALFELLDQKEERIEQLIRENERLRNELERLKKQE